MQLVDDVKALLEADPQAKAILDLGPFSDFPTLAGAVFKHLTGNAQIGKTVADTYRGDPVLADLSVHDIAEAARRNVEPGGAAATCLFARGAQAIMAHRVAHKVWTDGDTTRARAVSAICGRALDTDIHPAARIGAGLWLDHGLGFVAGETSVIEEDVSIWHNVTLGSTLSKSGPKRHPHVKRGAVIGAGAILLGGITIGAAANIGAGAIVLEDVPEGTLIAGQKAMMRGTARVRFTPAGSAP